MAGGELAFVLKCYLISAWFSAALGSGLGRLSSRFAGPLNRKIGNAPAGLLRVTRCCASGP